MDIRVEEMVAALAEGRVEFRVEVLLAILAEVRVEFRVEVLVAVLTEVRAEFPIELLVRFSLRFGSNFGLPSSMGLWCRRGNRKLHKLMVCVVRERKATNRQSAYILRP